MYGSPYVYADPHATAGLTTYANGAVTPTKTLSVQLAEAAHLTAKALHYPYYGYPYTYGAHVIGKREAEADADAQFYYAPYYGAHSSIGLTAYANGAVTPTKTLAVQAAEAAHFAAKAAHYPYGYPYAYGAYPYYG